MLCCVTMMTYAEKGVGLLLNEDMASGSPSVAGEPRARYCHAAVGVGQRFYAWGG